jgi:hypothetical protein
MPSKIKVNDPILADKALKQASSTNQIDVKVAGHKNEAAHIANNHSTLRRDPGSDLLGVADLSSPDTIKVLSPKRRKYVRLTNDSALFSLSVPARNLYA